MGKVTFFVTSFTDLCDQVIEGGYRDAGFKSWDYLGTITDGYESKVTVLMYRDSSEGTYVC